MALRNVALVIADISGYTEFIRTNKDSLEHAAEVISQLLELVTEQASHPLMLNKLEGDAAFLFADLGVDDRAGAADVLRQIRDLFQPFHDRIAGLARDRAACPCDACRSITKLRLKVVAHQGPVVSRAIRGFEELTGEDVILVHRLLKNTIPANEYIAITEAFHALGGAPDGLRGEKHTAFYEDVGPVALRVYFPDVVPVAPVVPVVLVVPVVTMAPVAGTSALSWMLGRVRLNRSKR